MSTTTESSAGHLPTKEPSPQENSLITSILKLYRLKPDDEAYSHYAENAIFHDPVSIARGKESIMSQFNGMPKVFARSETKEVALLQSSTEKNLEVNLTQHYVFKSMIPLKSEGSESTVNSKLTFKLNGRGLIEEHHEEWNHQGNKDANDGFWGKMQQKRKEMDAKLVEKAAPSDPKKL